MSPRWTRMALATTPGGLVSAERKMVRKIASENKHLQIKSRTNDKRKYEERAREH